MPDRLLALDIGTQSTRAAVVAADGSILGIAQRKHDVESPSPGWAQQDPDAWWAEACGAIRSVLEQAKTAPGAVAGIAACGQMHGPVGVGRDGRVTTARVQLWCDKRCGAQAAALRVRPDADRLAALAGSAPNPAWIGVKVRWIRDREPAAYDGARWFLVPKDFVNFRLTGVAATDPSEASGSFLWDAGADRYSEELAGAVGVDLGKFAPVHPSHAVVGRVTPEAAAATGLLAGTPVVAGGGDFPVSMLGFGIVGAGVTADVTGTSMLLAAHTRQPLRDPSIQNLRHVVDGWIPFTIIECGGLSMKWCRDLVASMTGRDVSYDELIAMAERAPAGSDGLLFYPYMLGERRAENTAARGGFIGLTLNHAAPHLVRAVMEGVALGMGKDVERFRRLGHDVTRILGVGGGARNRLWTRIKASVFRVPVEIADEPEAGIKGAALLAAAGVGLVTDLAGTAVARRAAASVVEPDPAASTAYAAAQAEFNRVYDHLLGFWPA
jgi:xylulokinase